MTTLLNQTTTDSSTDPSIFNSQNNGADTNKADALASNPVGPVLTLPDIQKLLPHRYPFLLVDRIIEYVPGDRATGIKNVTANEPQFQGHFPGQPIMPGVFIVEAMAQVSGIILSQMLESTNHLFLFAGIDKVRFRQQVIPGDQLVMTAQVICIKQRRFAKVQARAQVNENLVAEGELSFFLRTP